MTIIIIIIMMMMMNVEKEYNEGLSMNREIGNIALR